MGVAYNIYKKSAAMQVKFISVKEDNKPHFLLLEASKGLGDRRWDWENKITFKLGERDLMQLCVARAMIKSKGKVELIHDPMAGKESTQKLYKTLSVFEGQQKGTFGFSLSQTGKDKVTIFLDLFEMNWFELLCKAAIPYIYRW